MVITRRWLPNVVRSEFTTSTAAWRLIATDGTGHADYPTLINAGKVPFPGPVADFPGGVEEVLLRSENGSGADGSPFYVDINRTTVPTDTSCYDLVSGSGQTLVDSTVKLLWIRKTTAGDRVIISGRY